MTIGQIVNSRKKETIELSLPVNPAYVTSARLTASSIANRMGFDIECTEDIKSAVSEACAYLIHKKSQTGVLNFKIFFTIYDKEMEICLLCENSGGYEKATEDGDSSEEYGIKMIKALMDKAEITENGEGFRFHMSKTII